MTQSEVISFVNNIPPIEKLAVYMDYFIAHTAMKHDFIIVDKTPNFSKKYILPSTLTFKWNHGMGFPDKETHDIAFYFIHAKYKILSFEEYISTQNVRVIDNGKDWAKNGFAQKISTDLFGIYDHYYKHLN